MTAAAVIFCAWIAVAFADGFGRPAFVAVLVSDAFGAMMPFVVLLLVSRFAVNRLPARRPLVERIYTAAQVVFVTMSFGWWWIEPHAALTSMTSGSLAAMMWLAVAGAVLGLAIAMVAERVAASLVLRELAVGTWTAFLFGGGRLYREFDHVEAGARLAAASAIATGAVAAGLVLWLLLRHRPRLAAAFPAIAPAATCMLLLATAYSPAIPQAPAAGDSIVLVVVDTLRADIADGRFAADPGAMPELARIAADGVRFTQAISPAPWTLPAVVSMLGGWNPHRHGYGATASDWEVTRGNPDAMFLAGAMRDAGYLTSAFVNNPWLRPWFGFDDGFYRMRPYHGRAVDGAALALDWIHAHDGTPSFTLLHLMDPHWPYDAPPGFGPERQECAACDSLFASQIGNTTTGQRAEIVRRYVAEVRFTDAVLGRFYDTLSQGGALEHTWLIVTADHGEEFWEHGGFLHGHSLYDELLRVPLVVVPPKADTAVKRGLRVDAQVRLEDVGATLLDIAGIDVRRAVDGRTLRPLLGQARELAPRVEVAGFVKSPTDLRAAVRRPPWKAILSSQMHEARLFDLLADPGEQKSLLFDPSLPPKRLDAVGRANFSLHLAPSLLGLNVSRTAPVSTLRAPEADTRKELRSLGYAQ